VYPDASNVIPGEATLSLDVRHPDERVRIESTDQILERGREIATRRGVETAAHMLSENSSVSCSPRLQSLLAMAVEAEGIKPARLASGAGHDAVPMSELTAVAMLFVRCKGGISHNPAESVTAKDVSVSIDVLTRFLELLAEA
jgi:acetylornithine deacetylase/succinyl-diaminopimelate desuccinylase-like protein